MKIALFIPILVSMLLPKYALGQSKSFTSVPTGSWQYTAYHKLVKLGFAQPLSIHNEFSTSPTLTRYEFAVVTDRLMHRIAERKQQTPNKVAATKLIDKLAKEFRPEIDKLKSK